MAERDPSTAPRVGDTVWFVYTGSTRNKKLKSADIIEDPLFVLKHKIPFCPEEYLDKQIRPPLERIFQYILKDKEIQSLWNGPHTLKRKTTHSLAIGSKNGIYKFMIRTLTCQNCKCSLEKKEEENKGLCKTCEPQQFQITSTKKRTI